MKSAFAISLVLALMISALAGTLFIGNVAANFAPAHVETFDIKVQSPTKNKVYNTTEISLEFYAIMVYSGGLLPTNPQALYKVLEVQYWLDGKLLGQQDGEDPPKTYSFALTGLSDGEHSVKVWMKVSPRYSFDEYLSSSKIDSFRVDTSPPSIRVLTSQETFGASSSTADVPLNFTMNEPVSWIGYSLDGKNVITVTDDVASSEWFGGDNYRLVLSGLPVGLHSLTVYADDAGGNRGASEPFSFTVTQQTPSETGQTQPEAEQTEPFPTALATVGISTAVVAVSSGLLFYFKKRKR